ncbi:MAG: dihydrolipoamide acetyltransferase family protein [Deinococcales bacterium]
MREFLMPELAESVVEGEILKWLVAEGERANLNEPLVEVMTDKVTVELPSPYDGILEKHLAKEGEIVKVKSPLARFADENLNISPASQVSQAKNPEGLEHVDHGESLSLFKATQLDDEHILQIRRPNQKSHTKPVPSPNNLSNNLSSHLGSHLSSTFTQEQRQSQNQAHNQKPPKTPAAKGAFGRPLAVPTARKLAREHQIALEDIAGSGPNGRIRLEDIRNYLKTPLSSIASKALETHEAEERLPLRGLRRVISQHMLASHQQTVRTLIVDEADVSGLIALRDKLKSSVEAQGSKLNYLPFIIKAAIAALKQYPIVNSSLDEAKQEIVIKKHYHIGMAVASEQGLVVPVIHDADKKSILSLAQEIQQLAQKTRDHKLNPQDIQGSTFSITSIGNIGGLFSFPIINLPEAAILGIHTIKKRPIVIEEDGEDKIVARPMLYLSHSFDHRLIDGADATRFLRVLISYIENPELLMLH